MNKGPVVVIVILLAVVLGGGYIYFSSRPLAPPVADAPPSGTTGGGQSAPPFTLQDMGGNTVSSSQFVGKPLVVNFFATWCPPCKSEIPGFVAVYEKYKGQGFELVGIALDTDTKDKLPGFIAEQRISYKILLGNVETARNYGGVSSIPTTFFIGKGGLIQNVHVGFMSQERFEQEVQKLL